MLAATHRSGHLSERQLAEHAGEQHLTLWGQLPLLMLAYIAASGHPMKPRSSLVLPKPHINIQLVTGGSVPVSIHLARSWTCCRMLI